MMTFLMSVSFVLGIFVASVLWKREINIGRRPQRPVDGSYPFRRAEAMLTDVEKNIYLLLKREVGDDKLVLPKVRLSDLVALPKNIDRSEFLLNLVKARGLDFVICSTQFAPLLALQTGQNRNEHDNELIEEIASAAGLPYLQLPNKKDFSPGELNELVREALASARARRGE